MGDFNARTGCAIDFNDIDQCMHIPRNNYLPSSQSQRKRKNYDNQFSDHGKTLLDICKTCDLQILNGRTTGDSFGKITFHSTKGVSTLDYSIVSHKLINLFENLIVKEPNDGHQSLHWPPCTLISNPEYQPLIYRNSSFGTKPLMKYFLA